MRSLRRVLGAPVLWVSLVLLQWGIAWAFARPIAGLVRAAMGEHALGDPRHLLPGVVELFADNPSLGPAIAVAALSATILGGVMWLVAAGGVIARLAGERGVVNGVANSVRFLPGIVVLGAYGLVPRAVAIFFGLGVDVFGLGKGMLRGALFLALWGVCAAGEGMARASLVIEGGSAWHPRRLAAGYREALRRWRVWGASVGLTAIGAGIVFAMVVCVTRSLGEGWGVWAVRGIGGVGVGVALWRVAVFVEAVQGKASASKG